MIYKSSKNNNNFPKKLKKLSSKQKKISDDFMKYWHEVLRSKYTIVDKFNHKFIVNSRPNRFKTVLEIGAGDGEHLYYEKLSKKKLKNYYALDIRKNMLTRLINEYKDVNVVNGDCQKKN